MSSFNWNPGAEKCLRRWAWLGLAALPALVSAQTALSHPPSLRSLTSSSAIVWTRAVDAGGLSIDYRRLADPDYTAGPSLPVLPESDFNVQFSLTGLSAGTTYAYRLRSDSGLITTDEAFFTTVKANPKSLSLAVFGDFAPPERAMPGLRAAGVKRPDLLAVIGDLDHRGPAKDPSTRYYYLPGQEDIVLENMRNMRREVLDPAKALGADFHEAVTASTPTRSQAPLYYVWDDHDYCVNNADATCPFAPQAHQAYREFFPAGDAVACAANPIWRRLSYGTLADVFLLDSRSERVAGSMLGACQRQWLLDNLLASTATWKVLLSPLTFNPATKPFDAWGAFQDERLQILNYVRDLGIHNVIVLSADIHSGGAIDDGTNAGLPEVSVPHANMPYTWVNTYCREDDGYILSTSGSWTLGSLTEANVGLTPPICGGFAYPDKPVRPIAPGPYPLDGTANGGYATVDLKPNEAVLAVRSIAGDIKRAYQADGKRVPLRLRIAPYTPPAKL